MRIYSRKDNNVYKSEIPHNSMKKSSIFLLALFAVVFLSTFVAAATVAQEAASSIANFFEGAGLSAGMMTKILLIVLLWLIVWNIVHELKLGGNSSLISSIIALIISILAFIYIPQEEINAIVLQYGAMGSTILTVIPFIIILWFSLRTDNLFIARITWIFYVFYYFLLFVYKWATTEVPAGAAWWTVGLPYLIALVMGIIIFFVLAPIRNLIFKGEMEKLGEKATKAAAVRKTLVKAEKKSLEAFGSE